MNETNTFVENQQSTPAASETQSSSVAPAPAPAEKMIPQSKVDEIVRHSNARVAQKAHQDAVAEYQRTQSQTSQQANSFGGMPTHEVQALISQQVNEKLQEKQSEFIAMQQREYGDKIAADFQTRLDSVKQNYSDFDEVVSGFQFSAFPHAVHASLNFENTGDIMYELASNPSKMEVLESLAKKDAEMSQRGLRSDLAYREMKKLSEATRINKAASTVKTANAPLSQIQPSPTGTDNGSQTVSDFRAMFKTHKRKR
jgi:hypothetical protein